MSPLLVLAGIGCLFGLLLLWASNPWAWAAFLGTLVCLHRLSMNQAATTVAEVHDLRSPVSRIRGFAELLLRHSDASTVGYAQQILAGSGEIDAAIDQLLRRSRDSRGRRPQAKPSADIHNLETLIAARLRAFRGLAKSKDHPLYFHCELAIAVLWRGDVRQLLRVLDNLLANAIHHGSGPVHLGLRWHNERALIELVNDNDTEVATTPRKGRLTSGFGLGITRSIARSLGIQLLIHKSDQRYCAQILLPAQRHRIHHGDAEPWQVSSMDHLVARRLARLGYRLQTAPEEISSSYEFLPTLCLMESEQALTKTDNSTTTMYCWTTLAIHELMAAMAQLREPLAQLLVVDDDPLQLLAMREQIRGLRIPAHFATCLDSAGCHLAIHTYQLVLCDLHLPDGGGNRLAEKIRPDVTRLQLMSAAAEEPSVIAKPIALAHLRFLFTQAGLMSAKGVEHTPPLLRAQSDFSWQAELAPLIDAIEHGETEDIADIAHRLRGAALMYKHVDLANVLKAIEKEPASAQTHLHLLKSCVDSPVTTPRSLTAAQDAPQSAGA